jgi:hypothetical protein
LKDQKPAIEFGKLHQRSYDFGVRRVKRFIKLQFAERAQLSVGAKRSQNFVLCDVAKWLAVKLRPEFALSAPESISQIAGRIQSRTA